MPRDKIKTSVKLFLALVFVYFFLVSISLMEAAFKGFGKDFAEYLIRTTSNPFVGLFIGILATSIIQSSSTTTSMVVGMVGSGVLTISNAIPIIMGANIGTTVTNLMVAIGHFHRREEFRRAISGAAVHDFFNFLCVLILFPLEVTTGLLRNCADLLYQLFANMGGIKFTSPIRLVTKPIVHFVEDLLMNLLGFPPEIGYVLMLVLSVLILSCCLFFIVKIMRTIVARSAESAIDEVITRTGVWGIFTGLLFTAVVQSSSITTSLLVPLIAGGIMTVEAAFPVTLGANIGTTVTAILASFALGAPAGITIAFVHLLFNVIGVLVFYPIKFMRSIPIGMAKWLGNKAFEKRRYAFVHVLGAFFLIPALLILIFNLLNK